MISKKCSRCLQECEHVVVPLTGNDIIPEITIDTCSICGDRSKSIPHLKSLDVYAEEEPMPNEEGDTIINAHGISINGMPVQCEGNITVVVHEGGGISIYNLYIMEDSLETPDNLE